MGIPGGARDSGVSNAGAISVVTNSATIGGGNGGSGYHRAPGGSGATGVSNGLGATIGWLVYQATGVIGGGRGPPRPLLKAQQFLARGHSLFYIRSSSRFEGERRRAPWPRSRSPPCEPASEARAARLAKFERERLIVDDLDRGVSVAEISALRRGRREADACRHPRDPGPPHAPASRGIRRDPGQPSPRGAAGRLQRHGDMNLKTVDPVVRIVREFDRHHGYSTAGRRLSESSPGSQAGSPRRPPKRPSHSARRSSAAPISRPERRKRRKPQTPRRRRQRKTGRSGWACPQPARLPASARNFRSKALKTWFPRPNRRWPRPPRSRTEVRPGIPSLRPEQAIREGSPWTAILGACCELVERTRPRRVAPPSTRATIAPIARKIARKALTPWK